MNRLLSCRLADLIGPGVNDRITVEIVEIGQDAAFEFVLCDATRIWRSIERASLEKKPSIKLSHEPCFGVNTKAKRPSGWVATQALVSFEMCAE